MTLQSISALDQFQKRGGYSVGYPANVRRFFAPLDDVHGVLTFVVKSATISLAVAMYGWDDDELDSLFRDAWQQENLPVQIALDKTQAAGVHEKEILAKWPTDVIGNRIVIGTSSKNAISHTKLAVIDGLVTVQGSTNWSLAGEQKQNNELTVIFDPVYSAETRAFIDLVHSEMEQQMQGRKGGSQNG